MPPGGVGHRLSYHTRSRTSKGRQGLAHLEHLARVTPRQQPVVLGVVRHGVGRRRAAAVERGRGVRGEEDVQRAVLNMERAVGGTRGHSASAQFARSVRWNKPFAHRLRFRRGMTHARLFASMLNI